MTITEVGQNAEVIGLTIAGESKHGPKDIPLNEVTSIILFGEKFSNTTLIAFTTDSAEFGTNCDDLSRTESFRLRDIVRDDVAFADIKLPLPKTYYVCVKSTQRKDKWIHQGTEEWESLQGYTPMLPLWLHILLIVLLLCFSGLFAGLNLGLMSLDKNELKVIAASGTDSEKMHAKAIEPIRKKGNYLLCTILLSNVMINSTTTVLLDQLTSGVIAVVIATLSIVILGDIIPQAICSRHGLAVGAKTIWITYFFMIVTFPLSYPISKILDWVLGEEIGQAYDRQKLMEFIKVTKDFSHLEPEEVDMITGALSLKRTTAGEVMTRLEDVFMLSINRILDFETVSSIQKKGYSRIPVYEEERKNIVALFHAKDLAFVDPNDNMPIKTLLEFYRHPILYTEEDAPLDDVLKMFKEGKSHLAFVRQVYESDAVDPLVEITGIITLEDIIEEILQAEIVDETDTLSDNRIKRQRKSVFIKDFSDFAKIGGGLGKDAVVSPQMALAAFQFLTSTVDPFKETVMSNATVKKLLSQKVYFTVTVSESDNDPSNQAPLKDVVTLYENGCPADFFILVLEGRLQVTVGREKLIFLSGPFSYFGVEALTINGPQDFISDYSVAVIETTTFIKITRNVYTHAYRANEMQIERHNSVCLEKSGASTETNTFKE